MSELILLGVGVRRDAEGRFSLNDLHRAAGGMDKHKPSNWFRAEVTQALCDEIDQCSDMRSASVVNGGVAPGTYVVKELVYAYAMWISPAFHLKVIRAYDALVATSVTPPAELSRIDILQLAMDSEQKRIAAEAKVAEQAPKVAALERLADAEGSLSLREAAKAVDVPERKFIQALHARGWIYRHQGGDWLAYSEKTRQGLLTHKVSTVQRQDGSERIVERVRVTPLGVTRLAEMLRPMAA